MQKIKLKSSDLEALYTVRKILDEHFGESNSIPSLAISVGINPTKLKYGFKELFNSTIFCYLTAVRMTKAKELLKERKHSIAEIANIVGYKYPQHFTVAFKKQFGCLPREMRLSLMGILNSED